MKNFILVGFVSSFLLMSVSAQAEKAPPTYRFDCVANGEGERSTGGHFDAKLNQYQNTGCMCKGVIYPFHDTSNPCMRETKLKAAQSKPVAPGTTEEKTQSEVAEPIRASKSVAEKVSVQRIPNPPKVTKIIPRAVDRESAPAKPTTHERVQKTAALVRVLNPAHVAPTAKRTVGTLKVVIASQSKPAETPAPTEPMKKILRIHLAAGDVMGWNSKGGDDYENDAIYEFGRFREMRAQAVSQGHGFYAQFEFRANDPGLDDMIEAYRNSFGAYMKDKHIIKYSGNVPREWDSGTRQYVKFYEISKMSVPASTVLENTPYDEYFEIK